MKGSTLVGISLGGTVVLAVASAVWHIDSPPKERDSRLLTAVGAVWLGALVALASEEVTKHERI
jgi:hypothetical protein